jgi:hypothetical protein
MKTLSPKALLAQRNLSLRLLEWHGGQSSALYAVGSCMLSDSDKGRAYEPVNHQGHAQHVDEDPEKDTAGAVSNACFELRTLKRFANFPEAVSESDEKTCRQLADRLKSYL